MDSNKMIKVTNRSRGVTIYKIPDKHIRREFAPKETKEVPFEEIQYLAQLPGGKELIYNYLFIDEETLHDPTININEEQEYWLTEDKIPDWMKSCSLDEFKDALDFAPDGVKDLIKKYAVSMPLNDVAKREALESMLNFKVSNIIENSKTEDGETPFEASASTSKRRSAQKYKIVNQD